MHGRPATLHVGYPDRSSPAGKLPSGRTEERLQSYRLRTGDGRDLSVPCFALVLPGRSASHRVRACGSPLFVDSRPGSTHSATLEPARCRLQQGTVRQVFGSVAVSCALTWRRPAREKNYKKIRGLVICHVTSTVTGAWRIPNLIVQDLTPPFDPARATDHYTAQASRSNIGIFINRKTIDNSPGCRYSSDQKKRLFKFPIRKVPPLPNTDDRHTNG
jgi:hypothetical protein